MREIITIGIGGAGCAMAYQFWRRVMREHNIDNHGVRTNDDGLAQAFFETSPNNVWTPRALFVDLDPTLLDEIKGAGITAFRPDFMVSGKAGTAGNFARGRYGAGLSLISKVEDRLRKLVDNTDNLQGFLIFHALGGGTGSGLGALILERLTTTYRKKAKVVFTVVPSFVHRCSLLEHYNALLALPALLDHCDMTFVFDNEALRRTCASNLNIKYPSYEDLNELISRAASDITAGIRFETGELNDLNSLRTKLIPHPMLQFISVSMAPVTTAAKVTTADTNVLPMMQTAVQDEPVGGSDKKYLAAAFVCRGDIATKDIQAAVSWLNAHHVLTFTDIIPTVLTVSHTEAPTGSLEGDNVGALERTVTLLSNTTGVGEYLRSRVTDTFDQNFAALAFVHAYVDEGVEVATFGEAREMLRALGNDYEDVHGSGA